MGLVANLRKGVPLLTYFGMTVVGALFLINMLGIILGITPSGPSDLGDPSPAALVFLFALVPIFVASAAALAVVLILALVVGPKTLRLRVGLWLGLAVFMYALMSTLPEEALSAVALIILSCVAIALSARWSILETRARS